MTVGQEIFQQRISENNLDVTEQSLSVAADAGILPSSTCRSTCDHCGGRLIEIRMKLVCRDCHAICETCCEGGRG